VLDILRNVTPVKIEFALQRERAIGRMAAAE